MNSYSKTALAAAICTALSAGHVGAANFSVTNTDDSGTGSLRDALSQAGSNPGPDIIDLSTVSGETISITSGQLEIDGDEVTINGAGATLDAGGNSRVLAAYDSDVTLNDLTITGGDVTGGDVGFPQSSRGFPPVGGGVFFYSDDGNLTINASTITNNSGRSGGGVSFSSGSGRLAVTDSTITANTAKYEGGGIYAASYHGDLSLRRSVISGNSISADGILLADESSDLRGRPGAGCFSLFEDNRVGFPGCGGGAKLGSVDGSIFVGQTTISGNTAPIGGGLYAAAPYGEILVETSTISGNLAETGAGGVLSAKFDLQVRNSTISGNSSDDLIGGLVLYSDLSDGDQISSTPRGEDAPRNILIEFTTITANSADDIGGLGISSDITVPVTASVISGNTAPTDPDIGFEPYSAAEADLSFTLVGVDSTSGMLNFDAVSTSLLGQDPLLGPLADNGGPTLTHLPGDGSPLIGVIPPGTAGCGGTVADDQGGQDRPLSGGCDIGSVERGVPAPPPPAVAVPVMDRIGLLLMAGLLGLAGLFGFRRRSELKR